jgi:hypothetical protein
MGPFSREPYGGRTATASARCRWPGRAATSLPARRIATAASPPKRDPTCLRVLSTQASHQLTGTGPGQRRTDLVSPEDDGDSRGMETPCAPIRPGHEHRLSAAGRRSRCVPDSSPPESAAYTCGEVSGTDTTWPTAAARPTFPTAHPKGRRKPGTRSRSPSAPSVVQKGSGLNLPATSANRYDHHEKAHMAGSSRRPTARCPQHQAALANSPQDRSTDHEGLLMIGANRVTATGDMRVFLDYLQGGSFVRRHCLPTMAPKHA